MEALNGVGLPSSDVGSRVEPAPPRATHRLLLVGDSLMRRECLEYMLRAQAKDLTIESAACVGEASGPRPDLLLLDIGPASMRNGQLHQQVAGIREKFGELPIMAMSDPDDIGLALEAIRDGLRGYLPTSLPIDTAIAAIRLVLAGGTYVPREVVDFCVSVRAPTSAERPEAVSVGERGFTDREAEIVGQLRRGKPNKIIAYELRISESTVKVHMRNIMRKLNATNRTQVAYLTREPTQ